MYVPWLAFSSCLRRLRLRAAVDSPKTKVLPTSNIRSFSWPQLTLCLKKIHSFNCLFEST